MVPSLVQFSGEWPIYVLCLCNDQLLMRTILSRGDPVQLAGVQINYSVTVTGHPVTFELSSARTMDLCICRSMA